MQSDLIFQQGVQDSAAFAVMQACRMVSRLFRLNRMLSFCRDDEWKVTAVIAYAGYFPKKNTRIGGKYGKLWLYVK
jgi:hypothetical protein